MIDEKFKDEVLSDKELDNVAGGTNGEFKELSSILPNIFEKVQGYRARVNVISRSRKPDEVVSWLKENLNIDAKIDVGEWWNPLDSAGSSNSYSRDVKSITHN